MCTRQFGREVVTAKEIPMAGNHKALHNELSVYKSVCEKNIYVLSLHNFFSMSINHPNLLNLLGTISRMRPHSMTNFVRGKMLHSLLFDCNDHDEVCAVLLCHCHILQLNYQEKVVITQQMYQGIVFMHSACPPVAHLDLKPENVLVSNIHPPSLAYITTYMGHGK